MTPTPTPAEQRPTARQLAYLKALAQRTGQTFTWPGTRVEASEQIRRLKQARSSTRAERELERAGDAAVREAIEDSAVIHGFELVGYGSNCTWSQRS